MRSAAVITVMLAIAAIAFPGCTVRITPPVGVANPVEIYLIDHGRHSSLVLPRDDGSMVEYAYGEWEWFAKLNDEAHRAPIIMLVPHRGTLGRRELQGPASAERVREQVPMERLHTVNVERERAETLRDRLDERFAARADTEHYNEVYELSFVHDDADYWLFNHCNTMTARWLRELGCRTGGIAGDADFDVVGER